MSVVDEIKSRLDIVDIVSQTVQLKKSGQSYTGFCPFHQNTRTPSFVVFPHTQTWHCFGACAEGGDLFGYVMKRDGLDFKEALQQLADKAGVTLDNNPEAAQHDQQRKKWLDLTAAAADYFHQLLLKSPAAQTVRDYLARRSIKPETISRFKLGYALNQWEALRQHLLERGYQQEDLLTVGLIKLRDDQRSTYDTFRHRLMIPIRDKRGRVIGFGARALADDQMPKYLNSPQTALFDKSANLYGLDLARASIQKENRAVIVEGYMDVIQAHQQGATNVVAQMGTALTEPQIKLLAPLTTRIVLALDSDAAGNAATVRSLSLARQLLPKKHRATSTSRGIELTAHLEQDLYIVTMPTGQDPDDVLRQGLDHWRALVEQATPALDFYERLILGQIDLASPTGKAFAVQELVPVYRDIKNEIERVARVQDLARKLGLDERLLLAELRTGHTLSPKRVQPSKPFAEVEQASSPKPPPEPVKAKPKLNRERASLEAYSLMVLLNHPNCLAIVNGALDKQGVAVVNATDFQSAAYREIFRSLEIWSASEIQKVHHLVEMVGPVLAETVTDLQAQWQSPVGIPLERVYQSLINNILRLRLKQTSKTLTELITLQRQSSDASLLRQYVEMVADCQKQRRQLEQAQRKLSQFNALNPISGGE